MRKKDKKGYFQTLSGIRIYSRSPKVNDIDISDIAAGLSKICRFAGQVPYFYSVAAHSLQVSYWIEQNGGTPKDALAGLLHDASEAYLSDLPSPAKRLCKDYIKLEEKYQKVIAKRFNLKYPFTMIVHDADKTVLFNEKLMQIGMKIDMVNRDVRTLFLNRFKELGGK